MKFPKSKDIIQIIYDYCNNHNISISKFAHSAGVSKSWISRLRHEDAEISLKLAENLLYQAGYTLEIHSTTRTSSYKSRLKKVAEKCR